MLVVVPDTLSAEIERRLEAAYAKVPEARADRGVHIATLLVYFNQHGVIPDFDLAKNDSPEQEPSP